MELRVCPSSTRVDVGERVNAKITDIGERMASLERMKVRWSGWAGSVGGGPATECPILEELHRLDGRDGAI